MASAGGSKKTTSSPVKGAVGEVGRLGGDDDRRARPAALGRLGMSGIRRMGRGMRYKWEAREHSQRRCRAQKGQARATRPSSPQFPIRLSSDLTVLPRNGPLSVPPSLDFLVRPSAPQSVRPPTPTGARFNRIWLHQRPRQRPHHTCSSSFMTSNPSFL